MSKRYEKEEKINCLKGIIEKLNQNLLDSNNKNTSKINELNKDNNKLNIEIERLNGEKKTIGDINIINQTLFKNIQNTFMDFKESMDKVEKESEKLLKQKHIEIQTKEIKNKSNSWIEDIRVFRETQVKIMNDLYEENIKKYNNKVNE